MNVIQTLRRRWSNLRTLGSDVVVVAIMSITVWRFGDSTPAGAILQAITVVLFLYIFVQLLVFFVRKTSPKAEEPADMDEQNTSEETDGDAGSKTRN